MIEFWLIAALIWLFVSALGFLFWKFLGWLFGFATRPPCAHCGRALTQNWSCAACENAKLESNPKPAVVHHSMQNDLQAAQRLLLHAKVSGVWDADKIRLITESLALLKPSESVPREIAVTREIPEKVSAPQELPISLRTELKPGNLQQTPKQTEGVHCKGRCKFTSCSNRIHPVNIGYRCKGVKACCSCGYSKCFYPDSC
jgi:hypothetical protein